MRAFLAGPALACARLFGSLLSGDCRISRCVPVGLHRAYHAGQGPPPGPAREIPAVHEYCNKVRSL